MTRIAFVLLFLFVLLYAQEKKDSSFFPYGLAQYRFRWDYSPVINEVGNTDYSFNYFNKIGIHFGFTIKINKQFQFQFQFGNDRAITDEVNYPINDPATLSNKSYLPFSFPCFHLAFVMWNPGLLYIAAGKIPLKNFGPLNLIERSLANGSYKGSAFIGWSSATNNSLFGVKTGLPIFKKPITLSAEFFTTVIKKTCDQSLNLCGPTPASFLFILNFPLQFYSFSLTPQIAFITNKNYDHITGKGDHEHGLGFTATYALKKKATFSVMGAWARSTYCESNNPVDNSLSLPPAIFHYDYHGSEIGLGSSINCGHSTIFINTKYNKAQNGKSKDSTAHFLYNDLKYDFNPHPQISISPRVRFFCTLSPPNSDSRYFMVRAELIMTGKI